MATTKDGCLFSAQGAIKWKRKEARSEVKRNQPVFDTYDKVESRINYFFPLEYLAMKDDEIEECEKKKAEERKRLSRKQNTKRRKA